MSWTAVAFHTPEYAHFAEPWCQMILDLGGSPLVQEMGSTGDWARNTGLKPTAILEIWDKVETEWFLYLDIDVLIHSAPEIPGDAWDVGVTDNRVLTHKNRISAADLVFKKNPRARDFLSRWQARCRRIPGKDHHHLTATINQANLQRFATLRNISSHIDWVPNGLRDKAELQAFADIPSPEASTVWFVVPSIKEPLDAMRTFAKWRERGYKVAVQRDPGAGMLPVNINAERPYNGYAEAVNFLTQAVLRHDPEARWIVTGGDDVFPDPLHDPEQIANECEAHFQGALGIMQPTGDRHLVDKDGRCSAERVCISPWMGREWCERAYQGEGPLCDEYFHFYVDEELHVIAEQQNLLLHRPDLSQYHAWWSREKKQAPTHFVDAKKGWDVAKNLFNRRKWEGFPGSELTIKA